MISKGSEHKNTKTFAGITTFGNHKFDNHEIKADLFVLLDGNSDVVQGPENR